MPGFPGLNRPFILHVGSNLPRKNRAGVLRIFQRMAPEWPGLLVFAGQALPPELVALAESLGIADRIVQIVKPGNETLEALYSRAVALVFPSRFEGFGWPLIEAQACGCPVVCSSAGPLPEVAGEGGLICELSREEDFAAALLRLTYPAERALWSRRGLLNIQRFTTERMVCEYLQAYRDAQDVKAA